MFEIFDGKRFSWLNKLNHEYKTKYICLTGLARQSPNFKEYNASFNKKLARVDLNTVRKTFREIKGSKCLKFFIGDKYSMFLCVMCHI